jgi:hypothetical protein
LSSAALLAPVTAANGERYDLLMNSVPLDA